MNRRKFMFRSILLVIATGFLYLFWWWRARLSPQDCRGVIVAVLRRRLDYLDLDPKGLRQFAAEVHESLDPYVRERFTKCSLFLPVYGLFDSWAMSGDMRASYLGLCDPLVTKYLLVTGFFPPGGASPDLSKTLSYVPGSLLARPPCGNPWADLTLSA